MDGRRRVKWGLQPTAFRSCNIGEIAVGDVGLARLLHSAIVTLEIWMYDLSGKSTICDLEFCVVQVRDRPERLKVWIRATQKVIVCFAVQISRNGGRSYEDPMSLVP